MAQVATISKGRPVAAIGDEDLLAWFDERLAPAESGRIEQELRSSPELLQRAAAMIETRDHGGHSLGEIWRRTRASCPGRAVWAAWVEGRLGDAMAQYLQFHLAEAGCSYCAASVEDLRRHDDARSAETRVRKIFQTSIGRLALPPDPAQHG